MLNRIKDSQAGIRAIARQQDHLYPVLPLQLLIEAQQFLHHWKSFTGLQWLLLVFDLIMGVSLQTLLFINLVTVVKIKQGAR